MQGKNSTVDSFPDTFDHGSSTSNSGVNQQLLFNDMVNPVDNRVPDYLQPSGDANAVSCGERNLSGWNLGESSSSENRRTQITHDEAKMDHGWSSSFSTHTGAGPRLDESRCGRTSLLSLGSVNVTLASNQVSSTPLFMQHVGSPQNINLNISSGDIDSGDEVMESHMRPHLYKPDESETEHVPSADGSADPIGPASGNPGPADEIDGRPGCSLDGRRLSSKRKAPEEDSEQLTLGGSSSCFQRAETSAWRAVPAHQNDASGSGTSSAMDNPHVVNSPPLNPQYGVARGAASDSSPDVNVAGNVESSQRNLRLRMNPAHQQDSALSNLSSTGNAARHTHIPPQESSSRLLPFNQSLDLRPAAGNTSSLSQSHIINVPGLQRSVNPFTRNGVSSSRFGSSSSSVIPGWRTVSLEEVHARSAPIHISEHPMVLPATGMRNLTQDPTHWGLGNGNIRIYGNVASSTRIGSSSVVHRSAAPTWIPQNNPPIQYTQRLSEAVRRSFFSEPGGPSNFPPLRSGTASQEMVFSSPAGHHAHHQPYVRSIWADRPGADTVGVPLSFRNVPSANEGRSRLISEIRNVLDFIRRDGESIRFEDVFILNQSVLLGVRELHDRHRGMRLDVDNMSYEELLALEESIGDVSTGLSEEDIMGCLRQRTHFAIRLGASEEVEPCCICQEEYVNGEEIGGLECGHDFHTGCIKQWLMQKNSCPICKAPAVT